jgi:hypothetical protein
LSCNVDIKELENISEVKKIEIITLKLDHPETYTNTEVNAQMFIAEPIDYNQEEYHKIWLLCDPGNYGETQEGLNMCSGPDFQKYIEIISANTDDFIFKISEKSLSDYNLMSKYIYIIGGICIDTEDECKKILENINSETIFNNNKIKISFKRLRVISENISINNENPEFEEILINNSIVENDKIKYNNEEDYSLKVKINKDSFDGNVGDFELMEVYYRTNFGYFSNYKTSQYYASQINEIETTNLIIKKEDIESNNKKIFIVISNLRGGINYREINVE